ncbi:hypothetical protein M422DRAFT_268838 [Sphaerobolus stellatus SS14]|uniref:URB1 N-terminal domain-containing protein n=1 Tax=Sphaerobolus stellatus (strain SS14) TaxID=990650 RepID=A0A0C9UWL3_SPHS4|nr:hypothetical protein M422DRAFT_268838 [Sphaerobolus stellatus SS14]
MVKRPSADHGDRKDKTKKPRHEPSAANPSPQAKFTRPEDIQAFLKTDDVGTLTQGDLAGLTTLRNQLTIRLHEGTLGPQDERLLLTKNWLEKWSGARDVFALIDRSMKPSANVMSLALSVLSALLNLLTTHFIYHDLGLPILKNLLSPNHMRILNSNLVEGSADVILSTLKLLNVMSNFAGGAEKRTVMDEFAWGQKVK